MMRLTGCLLFVYILHGCMPCYYAPSAQNVPLFQGKKEFNGSAAFQTGTYTMGYDFQGSLAVTDHLGVTANYSHYSGKGSLREDDDDFSSPSKGNMCEFGMGYYLPFKKIGVFETYAGYGSCTTKTDYAEYGYGGSTVHSSSFFLQPAIGLHKKHVELAFSTRFRILKFDRVDINYYAGHDPLYTVDDLQNNPVVCFLEPAFTSRFGGENFKFQFQIGISQLLSKSAYVDYDPFNLNLGLIFTIHGKKNNASGK